ncbi:DUF308 domain-containing protein [Methanobacterium alcaliphilum]|uniref:DUF308 domain-containing protein n=1 Tax=Methanobacterium alcaliphilum TaxID=392018 RepID=UPI00200B1EFC|nr:DUF308 domain-containing protein [Methanobacterium alcaliphilum]MCK9151048.1 DUF308 domain-containing protein [Methanobacterium alcaliphilum]
MPSTKQKYIKMREESDLSLEVILIIVLGVFMFLFGSLLFKIHMGDLAYNPDSTYGLFLVIVSFQIITMGKTPFGDLSRSWAIIIIGVLAAVLGMVSCFIPGYLSELVRILVGLILFTGGIALMLQLFFSKEKAKLWIKVPGILKQLIVACALVYGITIIGGLITLIPGITTDPQTAVILIIYGISFFYLAWCIQKATRIYPEEEKKLSLEKNPSKKFSFFQETSLPLSSAIIILVGTLLVLLGVLLFPVTSGTIPFSPDGQLGLLLVIVAIQMMALGETPMGQYKRSWLLIIVGLIFAALGIVSCIVPGILTGLIQILIGGLNIFGGVLLLIKRFSSRNEIKNSTSETFIVPPPVKKLIVTQTILNIVSIIFGLSMLLGGIIPGLVVAVVLVINGILLFALIILLQKITNIKIEMKKDASGG